MNHNPVKKYYKAAIGVLSSVILGVASFLATHDIPASLILLILGISVSLSIEIVASLTDLKSSLQREGVEVVSSQRARYQQQFLELKLVATRTLDISGIALDNALADFAQEPTLLRKTLTGLDVRLLFLDPSGKTVVNRAREEGIDPEELRAKLRDSVRKSAQIYKLLMQAHRAPHKSDPALRHRVGSLEIRIFDACPYCTVFRSDDRLLFGQYLSYGKGFNLAMFEAHAREPELRAQLDDHFNALWRDPKSRFLVRFGNYSPTPTANSKAFKDLAGIEIPSG